jgi:flavin-dependent dehydrogenase
VLIRRAGDLGVTVRQGCPVTTLERDGVLWRVAYREGARQEIIRARLLIGADGRNSRVARQLGLDGRHKRSGSLGFQLRLRLAPHIANGVESAVALYQFPGGYAGVVRVDAETINLASAVERDRCRGQLSFHALRSAHLDGNAALRNLLDHAEPCSEVRWVWPVYFPARRRFGPGFLLAGDAAQVTEPLTGEGIYFALRSGQLAALSAVTALAGGTAGAAALAAFEAACRREFAGRARLNRGLQFLVQRPALLDGALVLFGKRKRWLGAMLKRVCSGPAPAQPPHIDEPLVQLR